MKAFICNTDRSRVEKSTSLQGGSSCVQVLCPLNHFADIEFHRHVMHIRNCVTVLWTIPPEHCFLSRIERNIQKEVEVGE